jgi:hypothetical protein
VLGPFFLFLLGMECEHLRGLCRRDHWSTCGLYRCSLLSRDERAGPKAKPKSPQGDGPSTIDLTQDAE